MVRKKEKSSGVDVLPIILKVIGVLGAIGVAWLGKKIIVEVHVNEKGNIAQENRAGIYEDTIVGTSQLSEKVQKDVMNKQVFYNSQSQEQSAITSEIIHYSFGEYRGETTRAFINGKIETIPEGNGTMLYYKRVRIAEYHIGSDLKPIEHFADAGDCFKGSWGNGDIVSGVLYCRDGGVKERIVVPKRPEPYVLSFNVHY